MTRLRNSSRFTVGLRTTRSLNPGEVAYYDRFIEIDLSTDQAQ